MKRIKPIIIALLGKSASGKNILAVELHKLLKKNNIPSKLLLHDTTRPQRKDEYQDIDYHFVSNKVFGHNIVFGRYLEYTKFNDWYYGTNKFQIVNTMINIGVFNPRSLKQLNELQSFYTIIPIYIDINVFTRLNRSIKRENKIKKEFIRRIIADHKDFKNIEKYLNDYFKDFLIFHNEKNSSKIVSMIYY